MRNKTVTIVCVILILAAIVCFGYIFLNSKNSKKVPEKVEVEEVETEKVEVVEREERGKNVNVSSRIGLQLRELITYSDIYSNSIINELDQNGIDTKAKLLVALDKIYRVPEYQSYLEYSEEYNSTYILPDNMNKVLYDTFADTNITDRNVEEILTYDEATNAYIVVPRGFATGTISYTIEVPYLITQFSDRAELLAYRLYATKEIEMNEAESSIKINLFYDKSKAISALTIENEPEFTEENIIDYIKDKINSKQIATTSLETIKYIFTEVDGVYKISSFEGV